MTERFFNLSYREQIALIVAGISLSFFILWSVLFSPLIEKKDSLLIQNESSRETLSRVEEMVSELKGLEDSKSSISNKSSANLGINAVALSFGLKISRLTPNSRGEIEIRLEEVDFSDLVRWFYYVESELGFITLEAGLSVPFGSERINATLRFRSGR